MAADVRAPLSAVVELGRSVTSEQVVAVLREWLQTTYALPLESTDREGLMVEWRVTDESPFCCQVAVSDSRVQARRTFTVIFDHSGSIAFVDETPLVSGSTPHVTMDVSEPIQLLLRLLSPLSMPVQGLTRGRVHDLTSKDPVSLLDALNCDLSPGLLIAVVGDDGVPGAAQSELLQSLSCLAIAGTVGAGEPLLSHLDLSSSPRAGSLVCLTRSTSGLEAELLASTSIRTKSQSARRLLVRRQLSSPLPFDLERRRTAALRRLLASGPDIDLPTALQLLDEESQRANDLNNRVKELETLLAWAYEEHDATLSSLDDAQGQLRYMQKAFRELGQVAVIEPEDDDGWLPDSSLDALIAARELLPFLVIGPTDDNCAALDAHQKRTIWAKKIWLTLRALNDYCRTKSEGRFAGDIIAYRDDAPDGAIPLLAEYAPSESKSTSEDSALVAIRTFPVPHTVSVSGRVYMKQHVKIDKGGHSAPRIHLHDDSGGVTQRLYIGYIGPHLPTAGGF